MATRRSKTANKKKLIHFKCSIIASLSSIVIIHVHRRLRTYDGDGLFFYRPMDLFIGN